jgi:hypothetical protein
MVLTGRLTDSAFRCYDVVSDGDLKDAARELDEVSQQRKRG